MTQTKSPVTTAAAFRVLETLEANERLGVTLFGADFVPSAVTHPQLSSPDTVVDQVFSAAELELLEDMLIVDENAASNILGVAILAGRSIPATTLTKLLAEAIPYGFHHYIKDPVSFFSEIGEIAVAQQSAKIVAILQGQPEPTFADPAEIVFVRHTGMSHETAAHLLGGGGTQEAEVVEPTPAPQEIDPKVQHVVSVLTDMGNDILGEGNFEVRNVGEKVTVVVDPTLVSTDLFDLFGDLVTSVIPTLMGVKSIKSGTIDTSGKVSYDGDTFPAPGATLTNLFTGGNEALLNAIFGDEEVEVVDKEAAFDEEVQKYLEGIFGEGNVHKFSSLDDLIDAGDFEAAPISDADAKAYVNETLDETYAEFKAVADAGQNDATILAQQIEQGVAQQEQLINLLEEDADNLIKAAQNVKAGLSFLTSNAADLDRLKGNAKMVADAFDALSTDISTLQRVRAS